MNVSGIRSVSDIPAALTGAEIDLQKKLLAANATQAAQAIPAATLQQVLALLGYGANLDTYA